LSNNTNDYYYVSQGKTTFPNVDDGEEYHTTDVSDSVLVTAECCSKMISVVVTYMYFVVLVCIVLP
jgi:myosin heavy subunit